MIHPRAIADAMRHITTCNIKNKASISKVFGFFYSHFSPIPTTLATISSNVSVATFSVSAVVNSLAA